MSNEWKYDAYSYLDCNYPMTMDNAGWRENAIMDFIDCYWQNSLSNENNYTLFKRYVTENY